MCLIKRAVSTPLYFPTEQWLAEYGRLLDGSDALDDLSSGPGGRFSGDVLLVIEDLPLSETTLGDLPEGILEGLSEDVRSGIEDITLAEAPERFGSEIRPTLPDVARDLLEQIESNVVDGALYACLGLADGDCTDVAVLGPEAASDVGYAIRGPYHTWRRIVEGKPAAAAILTGDLVVEGNQVRIVQYSAMFQLLGEIAADVECVHLFDGESPSPGERLFDQAVAQPAFVQKNAQRQISRTLNAFRPGSGRDR